MGIVPGFRTSRTGLEGNPLVRATIGKDYPSGSFSPPDGVSEITRRSAYRRRPLGDVPDTSLGRIRHEGDAVDHILISEVPFWTEPGG